MADIPLVSMEETVECRYMSLTYFFLTVPMNLKASICEIDLTKENSVSALVLERIGMTFIPEKVVLKQYLCSAKYR